MARPRRTRRLIPPKPNRSEAADGAGTALLPALNIFDCRYLYLDGLHVSEGGGDVLGRRAMVLHHRARKADAMEHDVAVRDRAARVVGGVDVDDSQIAEAGEFFADPEPVARLLGVSAGPTGGVRAGEDDALAKTLLKLLRREWPRLGFGWNGGAAGDRCEEHDRCWQEAEEDLFQCRQRCWEGAP